MRPWSIEECEAYAEQLRDKNRACTAEHAAQAIEYLLGLVSEKGPTKIFGPNLEELLNSAGFYRRQEWKGLTLEDLSGCDSDGVKLARYWEAKLKEKNA